MPVRNLVTIVSLFAISCIFIGILIVTNHVTADNEYLIATVLGFASITIVQLVNAKQITQVEKKVDRVLNGEMEGKIQGVISSELDARGVPVTEETKD